MRKYRRTIRKNLRKLLLLIESKKQILLGFLTGILLLTLSITGVNYMGATFEGGIFKAYKNIEVIEKTTTPTKEDPSAPIARLPIIKKTLEKPKKVDSNKALVSAKINTTIKKIEKKNSKKVSLISNEAMILARNIISDEVIISDFVSVNELGINDSLDFISIGQGTLLKGMANPESILSITTRDGSKCSAQTNETGKFGCMFRQEIVKSDDLQVMYQ